MKKLKKRFIVPAVVFILGMCALIGTIYVVGEGQEQQNRTKAKLNHYSTLLSCCLRLSDAVTSIIPRLAIIWLAKPWINRNPTGLTTHP